MSIEPENVWLNKIDITDKTSFPLQQQQTR